MALEVPGADAALRIAHMLRGYVGTLKIGKGLFPAAEPATVRPLAAAKCFLRAHFRRVKVAPQANPRGHNPPSAGR